MTNVIEVRPIVEAELREAYGLTDRAFHLPMPTDEKWEKYREFYGVERKFVASMDGELVGVSGSLATELAVPGGILRAAAVTNVAVRADRKRRGVLTSLMKTQLRDCLQRGDAAAYLHASEAVIYGRFGFGVATRHQGLLIGTQFTNFRPEVPASGDVRILSSDVAEKRIPDIYRNIGLYRPGMLRRPREWWLERRDRLFGIEKGAVTAIHADANGDVDGYVIYHIADESPRFDDAIQIDDMHAANPQALAGLWRYLIGVDLISEVRSRVRPLDETVSLMLTDPRRCEVTVVQDDTWLRILDVLNALQTRTYRSADSVVIALDDPMFPENSGRYLISNENIDRTDREADLRLDVETLGMIYLGAWSPSSLASVGRISVRDRESLARADELFRTDVQPWCGTNF